jgi:hypothetical protein
MDDLLDKDRLRSLLSRMAELEKEIEEEIHRRSDQVAEEFAERRAHLEEEMDAARERLEAGLRAWFMASEFRNVLSAPFIYAMLIPIALLDLSFTLYQAICFRLYRIPRVRRSAFVVIDRHFLPQLNVFEKLNCAYCGYANGVLAYATEITSKTEQYWCPIKHAKRALGTHRRYTRFLEYHSPQELHNVQKPFRAELTEAPLEHEAIVHPKRRRSK